MYKLSYCVFATPFTTDEASITFRQFTQSSPNLHLSRRQADSKRRRDSGVLARLFDVLSPETRTTQQPGLGFALHEAQALGMRVFSLALRLKARGWARETRKMRSDWLHHYLFDWAKYDENDGSARWLTYNYRQQNKAVEKFSFNE